MPYKNEINKTQITAKAKIAAIIIKKIELVHSASAAFLQRKFNLLSAGSKRFVFFLFLFISSSACIFLLATSFSNPHTNTVIIKPIAFPKHIILDGRPGHSTAALLKPAELGKINGFRNYMDSLRKTASGKAIADSILKARPGLMDSISALEQLYHNISLK